MFERVFGAIASLITVAMFVLSVLELYGGSPLLRGLTLSLPEGLSNGSGVVAVLFFLILGFIFAMTYSLMLMWATRLSPVTFIIIHPVIGLISGFQSVIVASILFGNEIGGIWRLSEYYIFASAVGLSLAIEGALILRFLTNDLKAENSYVDDRPAASKRAVRAFHINLICFTVAWAMLMFEHDPTFIKAAIETGDPVVFAPFFLVPVIGYIGGWLLQGLMAD